MATKIKTTVKKSIVPKLDQYENCKKWFESKGFNFSPTRFGAAIKVNNKICNPVIDEEYISECETLNIDGDISYIKLPTTEELWQIIELQDLYEIYTQLKNEESDTLMDIFKKSLGGNKLFSEGSKTTARNFFFELKTASKFKKSNVEIFFDKTSDLVIQKEDCTYHIECKRIQTLNTLGKNIDKALEQFSRAAIEKSKRIISVDFSKAFLKKNPITTNKILSLEYINIKKEEFDKFINEEIDIENNYMQDISIFFAHLRFPAIIPPFNITSVNHFTLISHSNSSDCTDSILKLLHGSVGS